jgi:tetratricopeptide (TPR) repeat protein
MQRYKSFFLLLLLTFGSAGLFFLWYSSQKPTSTQESDRSIPIFSAIETIGDNANLGKEERLVRAKALLDQGFLSSAIQDLREILSSDPSNNEAQKLIISAYIKDQNYSEALSEILRVLQQRPQDTEFLLLRTEVHIFMGDIQNAKQSLAVLPEKSAEKIFYGAILSSFEGQDENAKKDLQTLQNTPEFKEKASHLLSAYQEFSLFPDGDPNHLKALLAKRYQDLGFHALTIETLRKTVESRPDYRDAWLLVGYSYLSLKKYLPAQNALEKALSLDPTKAETSFYLGLTLTELGFLDQAIIQLQNAVENRYEPQKLATKKLAETLFRAERYAESIEAYQKNLSGGGDAIGDFVRPVWISLDFLHSPEMGLGFAKQAITEFPNDAMSYNLMGWALLEKGDYELAENSLNRAKSINGNMAAIFLNFGKLKEKQGRNEEALEYYKTTFELDRFGAIGTQAAEKYNSILQNIR